MNKAQLIEEIALTTSERKSDITRILDAQAVVITDFLKQALPGDSVTLPGIGKLVVVSRKARDGRNPITGGVIKIPGRLVVQFTPTPALKAAVNEG